MPSLPCDPLWSSRRSRFSSSTTAPQTGRPKPCAKPFPLLVLNGSRNRLVRRNEAAGASGRILVSIDDDAEFRSNDVVARTVADFDEPRVGVVAIPYVDLPDERVLQRAPATDGVFLIHRFRGTAYAVLRDVFLQVGGFRTSLVHQAEEADFSLRLLDAGYVVRVGNAEPIHHSASSNRYMERVWSYECRNGVLFAWHNVPMPDLASSCSERRCICSGWGEVSDEPDSSHGPCSRVLSTRCPNAGPGGLSRATCGASTGFLEKAQQESRTSLC